MSKKPPKKRKKKSQARKTAQLTRKSHQLQNNHQDHFLKRPALKKLAAIMQAELNRSLRHIQSSDKPPLYYLSYLFRNIRYTKVQGRLGAIHEEASWINNSVYCDARVGSYAYDNVSQGGLDDSNENSESTEYIRFPQEIHADAVRFQLWKLTDACYREAAASFYRKKSTGLHFQEMHPELPAMRQKKAIRDFHWLTPENIDTNVYKNLIRKAGRLITSRPFIKNSWFEFHASQSQKVFVNSEGSEILQQSAVFELRVFLWTLSKQGEPVSYEMNFNTASQTDLPDKKEFIRALRKAIATLEQKLAAPRLNSYSGPVLLSPQACGTFFHEVLGHRLEGSRLLSSDEGATFKDQLGRQILPDYIHVYDDPTMLSFEGQRISGHFQYDDEGSHARRADLIIDGRLQCFLSTRSPIPGQADNNGHARNQLQERPISRMANLVIENRQPVTFDEMFQRFLAEIRRQKKEYGIWVQQVQGGETGTNNYDFQAFKGEIMLASRVWADGRQEMIRGVDFIGTPLAALESLLCLGNTPVLENAWCGAESGLVPVSTIAPAMLLGNLELQGQEQNRYTDYLVPVPYA
ncbi:MAG: hypothetical protein KDK39_06965 [Leptospiraceae bacterium]|nr:hypothetical protein [Leptospiraceae bacterium]